MSKYAVTAGVQDSPVKTVLYGPEGIGKSTFASHFPDPVFIDTEGGTKRLNVKRLPQPTSWASCRTPWSRQAKPAFCWTGCTSAGTKASPPQSRSAVWKNTASSTWAGGALSRPNT